MVGPVNVAMEQLHSNKPGAGKDYLNTRERLYVIDGFADGIRRTGSRFAIICSRPDHALFMRTMLIGRPQMNWAIWRAGLRDLQCRCFPSESPDGRYDVSYVHRSLTGKSRDGDSGHRVCRGK